MHRQGRREIAPPVGADEARRLADEIFVILGPLRYVGASSLVNQPRAFVQACLSLAKQQFGAVGVAARQLDYHCVGRALHAVQGIAW